jgi:hypothetical protein
MRYFIYLLVFIFATSCRNNLPIRGTASQFQTELTPIRSQILAVDFSMRYDSLFSYLAFHPGSVIFDSKNQSGIDFPLQVALLQMPRIQVESGGKIGLQLPVKVEARPNLAGINTGLIQAKSNLLLNFQWDWRDINHHTIDQFNINYQWISKPEIRLMGFPVQVQGVVDPLLQRQLPNMQALILTKLNQTLRPNALANLLNRVNMNYSSPFGTIALRAADVDVHALQFNPVGLTGKLLIRTALHVGDTLTPQTNRWLEMKYQNQALPFQVQLSYERLTTILLQSMKLKYEQFQIHGDSLGLHVVLKGFGTDNAEAILTLIPTQLDSNTVGVQLKDMSVNGVPFFIRGHIKRKVFKAIHAYKWSTVDALKLLNQNTWGLALSNGDVQIQQVTYTPKGLGVSGEIRGNWELRK